MKTIFRNLSELYWGADFYLLKFDRIERSRFIRYEVMIILLSCLTFLSAKAFLSTVNSVLCGLVVFCIYKWFLSNLNLITTAGNTNKFYRTLLCTSMWISVSYGLFKQTNLYFPWEIFDIESLIVGVVILIVVLFSCYAPARFSPVDGIYTKLLRDRIKQDESNAKLIQQSEFEAQKEQINRRLIYEKQQNTYFDEQLNKEVLQTRIRLAKEVLAKWEEEQKKNIEQNWKQYIAV